MASNSWHAWGSCVSEHHHRVNSYCRVYTMARINVFSSKNYVSLFFFLKAPHMISFSTVIFQSVEVKKASLCVILQWNCIIFHGFSEQKGAIFFGQFSTKTATVQYTGNPSLFEGLKKMPLWDGFFSSLSFRSKHNGLSSNLENDM